MTKIFWVALILGIIGLLVGCADDDASGGSSTNAPDAKLNVVATTVQITALTREVAGDNVELHGLIPAGADPHDFEPTAGDLQAIENADVILRHGIGLDDFLDDTLGAGTAEPVTVTEGIHLRKGEEDGEEVDDPHVWLDPDNGKIMVDDIAAALSAADPANESSYNANAAAYKQRLDATREEVQAIIGEIPEANRKLVTDHDAFGYFADAFGLEVIGAIFPTLGSQGEPSAGELADLLDLIEREDVKAIFAEESVNSQVASTLASDAGVTIVDDLYGDSLGGPGSGAETVDGMLLANARKIADALK
jgi:zinc/manganese transport system substrate-binding protein/manganese/iron transport system substrate-binding protein